MNKCIKVAVAAALVSAWSHAGAVNLTAVGYSETFDSMGVAGTTPPAGWSLYNGASGTSNSTWTTTIPGAGVAAMVLQNAPLTATANPTSTNNNGFNAAMSVGTPNDRVLATSPTTISGSAFQLQLTNQTGFSFDKIRVGYDTVRFASVSTANELPGYWLFSSLDGTTWTNVSALSPTIATVPNTVGVTSVAATQVALGGTVAAGGNFFLRWVDDNARQTSPDQIIGLNNVNVAAVPEPETYAMMAAGLVLLGVARSRKRVA